MGATLWRYPGLAGKAGKTVPNAANGYDLFLSYTRADSAAAEKLRARLAEAGLHAFLDRYALPAGQPWQPQLEAAIAGCRTLLVLLGSSGLGTWQHREIQLGLDRQAAMEKTPTPFAVIPVLLPGLQDGNLPLGTFLALNTWIDLRPGLDEPEALQRLVAGAQGRAIDGVPVDGLLAGLCPIVACSPSASRMPACSSVAPGSSTSWWPRSDNARPPTRWRWSAAPAAASRRSSMPACSRRCAARRVLGSRRCAPDGLRMPAQTHDLNWLAQGIRKRSLHLGNEAWIVDATAFGQHSQRYQRSKPGFAVRHKAPRVAGRREGAGTRLTDGLGFLCERLVCSHRGKLLGRGRITPFFPREPEKTRHDDGDQDGNSEAELRHHRRRTSRARDVSM